jgi:hypothetical protein
MQIYRTRNFPLVAEKKYFATTARWIAQTIFGDTAKGYLKKQTRKTSLR